MNKKFLFSLTMCYVLCSCSSSTPMFLEYYPGEIPDFRYARFHQKAECAYTQQIAAINKIGRKLTWEEILEINNKCYNLDDNYNVRSDSAFTKSRVADGPLVATVVVGNPIYYEEKFEEFKRSRAKMVEERGSQSQPVLVKPRNAKEGDRYDPNPY